jgi:hypothetical protein
LRIKLPGSTVIAIEVCLGRIAVVKYKRRLIPSS